MVEYNSENFEELLVSLDYLEKELVSRGTKYFGGESFVTWTQPSKN